MLRPSGGGAQPPSTPRDVDDTPSYSNDEISVVMIAMIAIIYNDRIAVIIILIIIIIAMIINDNFDEANHTTECQE